MAVFRTSIGLRMLIGMNVLIIVLGAGLAVLAGNAAGVVVEQRLVRQVAENAGKFLADRRLPFSDALMNDLRRLFGVDFVAVGGERGELLASSLMAHETGPFMERVRQGASAGRIELGGIGCRFDSHEIRLAAGPEDAAGRRVRVFVVAPDTLYQDARGKAVRGIVLLAVPAIAVASLLAVAMSLTISRPLRRLAGEMDKAVRQGDATGDGGKQSREASFIEKATTMGRGVDGSSPRRKRRGPSEVVRLGESFDRLLKRLAQAQADLARSERLATLGRVAAGVAHELRNPLSGIKMNLRVLQDEMPKDAPGTATTDLVLREVDRMDLFLRELMTLAAGNGRDEPQAGDDLPGVDLAEVGESVVALLDGRLRHARVTVERSFPADLPSVRGDAPRVRQVLMNLIVNAVEAMPGGGTLRLSAAAAGGDNGLVRFKVADSGGGVHVRDMDIFDAFTSTKAGGVGLGLYLCRKIIQAHGGRIGYENTGQGAVFWFELPAVEKCQVSSVK